MHICGHSYFLWRHVNPSCIRYIVCASFIIISLLASESVRGRGILQLCIQRDKLQKLCETRRSARYDALHAIKLKWKTVLE